MFSNNNKSSAKIFDLTKSGGLPYAWDYQTADNERGQAITEADYFNERKPFHFARIELDNIIIDESNRLWEPDEKHVDELAESIETDGLVVPLGVKWRDDGERAGRNKTPVVDLIYGYHRLAALKKLRDKYPDVDHFAACLVYSPKLSTAQIKRMEAIENLKRRIPTDAEMKKFAVALGKNVFLLSVLQAVSEPVAIGGKNGAAAGEITLESVAKKAGKTDTWLRNNIKTSAAALGVTDYDNTNAEKRAELADLVASKIDEIYHDPDAGKAFDDRMKDVKRLEMVTNDYIEYVERQLANGAENADLAATIDKTNGLENWAVTVAGIVGLHTPNKYATMKYEYGPDRLAQTIINTFGVAHAESCVIALQNALDALNKKAGV